MQVSLQFGLVVALDSVRPPPPFWLASRTMLRGLAGLDVLVRLSVELGVRVCQLVTLVLVQLVGTVLVRLLGPCVVELSAQVKKNHGRRWSSWWTLLFVTTKRILAVGTESAWNGWRWRWSLWWPGRYSWPVPRSDSAFFAVKGIK